MNYLNAKKLADALALALADTCQRIEIAGSVRRKKPECGDLDAALARLEQEIAPCCTFS
jgi:DNA polymerase/3'-5' exonuclease PolX